MTQSKSFTAADLVVTDAIMAGTATSATTSVLTTGDLALSVLTPSRVVTIARSAAAASYTTDAIVIVDKSGRTTEVAVTSADGGDIARSSILLDNILTITLPAQVDANGLFTIGVDDIGGPGGQPFVAVELHTAGNLQVQYGEPSGGTDVLPVDPDVRQRTYFEVTPTRVVTRAAATNPTTVGVTVYY